jgi:hypothetical protein
MGPILSPSRHEHQPYQVLIACGTGLKPQAVLDQGRQEVVTPPPDRWSRWQNGQVQFSLMDMSQIFRIPISAKSQSLIDFPNRCVCCGAPKQSESTLAINRLVTRGKRQEQITLKYPIPHCQTCARSTQAVFLAGFIPFVLGTLVIGGVTFVGVALGASVLGLDDYGQSTNANSLVLGAAVGLFAGLIGGFLFEVAARLLLLPIFGRALWQAPLLAAQFLNDSDYVAGLRGKLDPAGAQLQLTFSNDEIAREFKAMNVAVLGLTQ